MSCFNSEKYLEDAIKSILEQDYRNFEFIIINDGSTDNTQFIINKFSKIDDRIIVLTHKNMGLTKSLNKGIEIAKGDFIARMDADDISLPFRFSKFIGFIASENNVELYSTPAILLNDANKSEKLIPNIIRRNCFTNSMLNYYCSLIHGTLIIKTSIIKQMKYDETFICAQDFELYHRAIALGYKISYDAKNISYKLRNHENNITKTKSFIQMQAFKRVLKMNNKKYYVANLANRFFFYFKDIVYLLKYKFN